MQPLTRHCPDDALPTLDTCVPQTQAARGFRHAPAVHAVVPGPRSQGPLPPSARGARALPVQGRRDGWSARVLVVRLTAPARWPRPARVCLPTPPCRTAPSMPRGVGRHVPRASPSSQGCGSAVSACAACEKN
jgi:hypothetical protein